MSYINILSKFSDSSSNVLKPIQPRYPLKKDSKFGFYSAITTAEESLNQDFKFLLLTEPGSWPMNPDLGIGLKRYLFENYESELITGIRSVIQNQLTKFLPRVRLLSANIIAGDKEKDKNTLKINIRYLILGTTEVNSKIEINEKGYLNITEENFSKTSLTFNELIGLGSVESQI
jgi:phage baseplate assembly protein W